MKSILSVFLVMLGIFARSTTHADVRVFFTGHSAALTIVDDLQLSQKALKKKNGKINWALATSQLRRFLGTHANTFGIVSKKITAKNYPSRQKVEDRYGYTIRLIQRFSRVKVEHSELTALFDNKGKLHTLNTSLSPTHQWLHDGFKVKGGLSKKAAKSQATNHFKSHFKTQTTPEFGKGINDNRRLIVKTENGPKVVWQFSLREPESGLNPVQIQIFAEGPTQGQVHEIAPLSQPALQLPKITIYDGSFAPGPSKTAIKALKVIDACEPFKWTETKACDLTIRGWAFYGVSGSEDPAMNAAMNLAKVRDFYAREFGLNGFDDQGTEIQASVNLSRFSFLDIFGQKQNAAWVGPWKIFLFGSGGDHLTGFTEALDVVAHEYTHAVIENSSNLIYESESGALNEHLADVFGELIQQAAWPTSKRFLIGEDVLTESTQAEGFEALRDMLHPEKGLSTQPKTMEDYRLRYPDFGPGCIPGMQNDSCGVHLLSGIPNFAVAQILQEIDDWSRVYDLFYRVMTLRLQPKSLFVDYRNQLLAECAIQMTSEECKIVRKGLAEAGFFD